MTITALSYFSEAKLNHQEINWKDFTISVICSGIESAINFGLGALLGSTGLWKFDSTSPHIKMSKKGWYRLNLSQKAEIDRIFGL